MIPFKQIFFRGYSFKTDTQLGLNYDGIAFKKIAPDERDWKWDMPI